MAERQIVREIGRTNQGPVGAVKVEFGNLLARNASGHLVHAADTAGLVVCGVCEQTVDNSAGAAGAVNGQYVTGETYWFGNDGTNPVTAAELGKNVYIKTSASVCAAAGSTNSIVAGVAMELSATRGVKIFIGSR